MDYAIRCDLPNSRVGALIGRKGEHVREVEKSTNTKIDFDEGGVDDGHERYRTITITGPLMSIYNAHMRLMQKYHQREYDDQKNKQRSGDEAKGKGKKGGQSVAAIDQLQDQIGKMESQLKELQRGGTSGGKNTSNGKGYRR